MKKNKQEVDIERMSNAIKRRYNRYLNLKKSLEKEGYKEKELYFEGHALNCLATVLMFPIIFLLYKIYSLFCVFEIESMLENPVKSCLDLILLTTILIVIHEFIHGLTWGFFAKDNFEHVEFGFHWKYLTPYCSMQSPLNKYEYILGVLMPTIILGFIPFVISILYSSSFLFCLSVLLILGGTGDFIVAFALCRQRDKEIICIDHPYKCGLYIFTK